MKKRSATRKRKPKPTLAGLKRQVVDLENQLQLALASREQLQETHNRVAKEVGESRNKINALKTCCRHYKGQRDQYHGFVQALHYVRQNDEPVQEIPVEVDEHAGELSCFQSDTELRRSELPSPMDLTDEPSRFVLVKEESYPHREHEERRHVNWEEF